MSYLETQCQALITVLDRAVQLKAHRLAGYVANVDFWADEVRHCLGSIDAYEQRFKQMRAATSAYVAEHAGDRNGPAHDDACLPPGAIVDSDTRTTKSLKAHQVKELRRELVQSAERFFTRCRKSGLIDIEKFRELSSVVGVGVADEAD